jgi:hypothetical protein
VFQIRQEQMDVLDACMLKRFIEETIVHLRRMFRETCGEESDEDLRERVQAGIDEAALYDITDEREVVLFIDLMVDLGPGFQKQEPNLWMEGILTDETLDQQEKIDTIYTRLDAVADKADPKT